MSDQLENFIRKNRDKLDQQQPGNEVWNNVQQGLSSQAAGSAASAAASTKAGLAGKFAQLSTGLKVGLGIAATALVATAIYVATSIGSGGDPGGTIAQGGPDTLQSGSNAPISAVSSPLRRVTPPIPAANIPLAGHEVDARKGGTIEVASGTTITIPKGAFVDANGQPVKGKVTIEYREFQDAFEALLSGIPMDYDNNGTQEHFQTAGMMEIQGSQAGAPVYIAEGKSIQVDMASFAPVGTADSTDSYQLWRFDEEQGAWIDIGKPVATQNIERKERIATLEMEEKKQRKPRKPKKAVGEELDRGIDINFKTSQFPELKPFKNVRWEAIDQSYLKENQWALTKRWSDVELEKLAAENEYRITFSNRKQKFELDVVPMLSGKDYEKALAQFDKKLARYNKLVAERGAEMDRLQNQASVIRSFSVSGFGIFNCDRFYRMPDAITIQADLQYSEEVYMDPEKTFLFHIAGDNRALVTQTPAEIARGLTFSTSEENYLVAVLPDQRIAAMKPADFRSIARKDLEKGSSHPVVLQTIETKVENALDLRTALGI